MSEHPTEPKVAPWEDLVLRLIAIYKLGKAIVSVSLGIGLLRVLHANLSAVVMTYVVNPFHFDPESRFWVWALEQTTRVTPHSLRLISYGAFFYAIIFATEGIGLYLRKHWAEYMVLISTGSLLPIEFWELYIQLAWWKLAVVVGNLAILLYLAHRIWLDAHSRRSSDADDDDAPPGSKAFPPRSRERPGPAVSKVR